MSWRLKLTFLFYQKKKIEIKKEKKHKKNKEKGWKIRSIQRGTFFSLIDKGDYKTLQAVWDKNIIST